MCVNISYDEFAFAILVNENSKLSSLSYMYVRVFKLFLNRAFTTLINLSTSQDSPAAIQPT